MPQYAASDLACPREPVSSADSWRADPAAAPAAADEVNVAIPAGLPDPGQQPRRVAVGPDAGSAVSAGQPDGVVT
jgi:hypothetical protein